MAKPPSAKNTKAEKPHKEASLPTSASDRWKGKAVSKADGIFHRLLDRLEPSNIVARERAKAEGRIIKAQNKAQVQIVRAEGELVLQDIKERAAARVLSSQIRQQENIESVMRHTYAALPQVDAAVSDDAVSEDFIHRFFDDSKNIGDQEMQVLWGRLLAGEIAQPGTYQPRTLSIIKDLTKDDAEAFTSLCRFSFRIGKLNPIIFDHQNEIYESIGVSFESMSHLENLGLLNFSTITQFERILSVKMFNVSYGGEIFSIKLSESIDRVPIGQVLLSAAGLQILPLTNANTVPGFVDYAIREWAKVGITVTPNNVA